MPLLKNILIYTGCAVIFSWGIAHIIPTKAVVKGFGPLSADNRRIITMEWAAEGMALCFIGLLVLIVALAGGIENPVSVLVFRLASGMLIVMAVWTGLTGARTSIIPIKICPWVKIAVAILFFLGSE
jgi:hypothetical protein